jgi:uncharacterized protein (TIGR02147 family)
MEKVPMKKSTQILRKAFLLKQKRNKAYSQNALARDLSLSPVFVSKVLTGAKSLPSERFKKVFKVLEMDVTLQSAFLRAVVLEALPEGELQTLAKNALIKESKMENYGRQSSKQYGFLKQWFNVAILSYLTCDSLSSSSDAIAAYFDLPEKDVQNSLREMAAAGMIEQKNGVWIKVENHSYFPTTKSHEDVRTYHQQILQKAGKELSKVSEDDFEKRLITSFAIAVNPDNVGLAKNMIAEFMGQISYALADGDCKEVYQCSVQLIPLRKAGR